MARRAFFSFHYQRDVTRAHVVRNSWVTKDVREDAGFFDSSVFESKKRTSEDALKQFLRDGLFNTSVTCVLIGAETAWRRWVRYELFQSAIRGNGLLGVQIHSIQNLQKQVDAAGWNPFATTGFEVKNGLVHFKELRYNSLTKAMSWAWSDDFPIGRSLADVGLDLAGRTNTTLEPFASVYDWNGGSGYAYLGNWVEAAARKVGK
ncbi:MAG: TIR domain-containing protein [Bryobacteraceae bacterium]|nr:TIR domain-containing protein [Bryobacteraceae bacterium]